MATIGICLPVAGFPAAEHRGRFQAVHLRHLHVHQNQIEVPFLDQAYRLAAGPGDADRVPPLLEERPGER